MKRVLVLFLALVLTGPVLVHAAALERCAEELYAEKDRVDVLEGKVRVLEEDLVQMKTAHPDIVDSETVVPEENVHE